MKPATEILLSAAFVLTPEENWTQGWLANDEDGGWVSPGYTNAVSFCAVGACEAARITLGYDITFLEKTKKLIAQATGVAAPADFNDTHTHAEVLEALYKAAELSEAS